MKILLITDNHSPLGGGAEKYFFTLKSELQKRKNTIVYSLGFGPTDKEEKDALVLKETPSKILRQWWRMFFNPVKYFQLRRAIKKINPDIIHLHNIKKYTISLLNAVKGYRVIQTVHDYSPICPTGWNVHQDLLPCATGMNFRCAWEHKRNYNGIAYLCLLYSFFRMKNLLRKTVKKFITPSPLLEHYLRINNFGATTYLQPFRKEVSTCNFNKMRPDHFLYVGQLETQKGVDILIREFAHACGQNKNLILKIAGQGSLEHSLRQTVKDLNLEKNIYFLGWVNPDALYEECAALIFASVGLESFGLVITEAMSRTRAVIGSNRGPTAWLVEDEKTGLLFDPLQEGDLAKKILRLANNKNLAEEYGRNSAEKIAAFMDNQDIIDKMLVLYANA